MSHIEIFDSRYARLKAVDWDFTDASQDSLASIHPYPARFIPDIPRELISGLGCDKGAVILDPFCGSGTTLLEAQRAGFESVGIDLNPIVTCSEIIEEVNDDALKKWFVGLQGDILPIDDEVQENVKKVVTSNPQLVDFKQVKSSGDAFLIATAMKYDLTVITEENKTGQKKIPFVCNSLGVPCVDILGLCEKEGWSF